MKRETSSSHVEIVALEVEFQITAINKREREIRRSRRRGGRRRRDGGRIAACRSATCCRGWWWGGRTAAARRWRSGGWGTRCACTATGGARPPSGRKCRCPCECRSGWSDSFNQLSLFIKKKKNRRLPASHLKTHFLVGHHRVDKEQTRQARTQ